MCEARDDEDDVTKFAFATAQNNSDRSQTWVCPVVRNERARVSVNAYMNVVSSNDATIECSFVTADIGGTWVAFQTRSGGGLLSYLIRSPFNGLGKDFFVCTIPPHSGVQAYRVHNNESCGGEEAPASPGVQAADTEQVAEEGARRARALEDLWSRASGTTEWSTIAEAAVNKALGNAAFESVTVRMAACLEHMCRVEVAHNDADSAESFGYEYISALQFDTEGILHSYEEEDGVPATTLYLMSDMSPLPAN